MRILSYDRLTAYGTNVHSQRGHYVVGRVVLSRVEKGNKTGGTADE